MTRKTWFAAAVSLLGLAALPASAMSEASALPREQHQGGVAFITGGIGTDEARAMQQAESQYPLTLEFVKHAKPRDEFLAAIDVRITNAQGDTQIDAKSDGPFLLAKLPPGRYSIRAERDGMEKTRQVTVARDQPRKVVFAW